MRITPIAHTLIDWVALAPVVEGTVFGELSVRELDVTDADHLAEFAGRSCYKAYNRERAATANTFDYLGDIISKGHESVFEHSSVTFYVQGVSRSLLTELERHRFLSFSVESQRYVDQAESHPDPVIPPALRGTGEETMLRAFYQEALTQYQVAVANLREDGYGVKKAREAARAYLPNCTPVDFVITANLRAWRYVVDKRSDEGADAEIQEFAVAVLNHLRELAPGQVQDWDEE